MPATRPRRTGSKTCIAVRVALQRRSLDTNADFWLHAAVLLQLLRLHHPMPEVSGPACIVHIDSIVALCGRHFAHQRGLSGTYWSQDSDVAHFGVGRIISLTKLTGSCRVVFSSDLTTPANLLTLQNALVGVLQGFPLAHADIHRLGFVPCSFLLAAHRVEVMMLWAAT